MLIVVDSREQCPFPFAHERYGAKTKQGALTVGDYSLAGLEDKVAVERKSLPDLVACLGRERERFERELMRGAALDAKAFWRSRRGIGCPSCSPEAVGRRST